MAVRSSLIVGALWTLTACQFNTSGGTASAGFDDGDATTKTTADDGVDDDEGGTSKGSGGVDVDDGPADATMDPDDGSDAPPADDGGPTMTEHLQHVDLSQCGEPLWCYGPGGLWDPVGVPSSSVECYSSSLPGPIAITSFEFFMPGYNPSGAPFSLQMWARGGGGPTGEPFFEEELSPAEMSPGPNLWTATTPVLVPDGTEFCIGLAVTASGDAAEIGFGVEGSMPEQPGTSYVRVFGPDGCNVPNWTDVASAPFTPAGNWCFSVDVQSPP